mmetsp:Transcript_9161/g.23528  ORF Transcript_9161/g.23528 Transcript_9161/m.23528 type:complete len:81 (+) Transcript_9161:2190-2432(+)
MVGAEEGDGAAVALEEQTVGGKLTPHTDSFTLGGQLDRGDHAGQNIPSSATGPGWATKWRVVDFVVSPPAHDTLCPAATR